MALSPIMTLPRLHYCLVVFAFNLVFYTHMRMRNTAYISFHHVEFYLRLRQLMTFPVWGQLYWDCQGEELSTIISGNMRFTLQCDFFWGNLNFWGHLHFWGCLQFWSRLHFWGQLHFWDCFHFRGHHHFWGCLHFWGHLHFRGHLHFDAIFSICSMSTPNLFFTASKSNLKHLR